MEITPGYLSNPTSFRQSSVVNVKVYLTEYVYIFKGTANFRAELIPVNNWINLDAMFLSQAFLIFGAIQNRV